MMWWYNLPEMVRFRIRFLIFEFIIASLLLIVADQGVFPWWFALIGIMVSGALCITFIAKYGVGETRWRRMGLDPETGEATWTDEGTLT